MIAHDIKINEFYWGLKSKFTLEVGLQNKINKNYDDIIWFKQGLFIITQFSTNQTTNKWTIKIQGKDKMCLLNGEVAGHLMHNTDFGREEYHDLENDTVTYTDIPLKQIIRSVVQVFGKEKAQNIIINDLDEAGMELMEYRGLEPLFLQREINSKDFKNILLDKTQECFYQLVETLDNEGYENIPERYEFLKELFTWDNTEERYIFNPNGRELPNDFFTTYDNIIWFKGTIDDSFSIVYDNMVDGVDQDYLPSVIKFGLTDGENPYKNYNYYLAKCEYGDLVGYKLTDLTYCNSGNTNTQELIGKAGETLTSVLDKIKNMLVNFEYFYDINGKFVFQKMDNQIISPWNSIENNTTKLSMNSSDKDYYIFNFANSKLISSFANNPKLLNLKNDYSIWGSYQSSSNDIPIHMRYAVDIKPTKYQPIRPLKEEIIVVIRDKDGKVLDTKTSYKYYDAPEQEPYDDNFLFKLTDKQKKKYDFTVTEVTVNLPNGNTRTTTVYPYFATQAYTTEVLDWRELIYQMALDHRKCGYTDNFLYYIAEVNPQYPTGYTGYEQYYVDILGAITDGGWRSLYNPNAEKLYSEINALNIQSTEKDDIYITKPFRQLTYSDLETLTYDQLYVFSSPYSFGNDGQGEKSEFEFIYPFVQSDVGNLELNKRYFLVKEGAWKDYIASEELETMENEGYAAYRILNNTSLKNIYVKNTQVFNVTPAGGKGPDYHIQVNENADDELTQELLVPYYDITSSLDTYQNAEYQDYILAIEQKFNNVLAYLKQLNALIQIFSDIEFLSEINIDMYENLLKILSNKQLQEIQQLDMDDFNSAEEYNREVERITNKYSNMQNYFLIERDSNISFIGTDENRLEVLNVLLECYGKYCIKDSGNIQYQNLDDKFKKFYYKSNFDIFALLSLNFLNTIDQIVIAEEPLAKLNYLNSICSSLTSYLNEMWPYNNADLNNGLFYELQNLLSYYTTTLTTSLEEWIWSTLPSDNNIDAYSYLPAAFNTVIQKIQEEYNTCVNNDHLTYSRIMVALNNINKLFNSTVINMHTNYTENISIINLYNDLMELDEWNFENVKPLFEETYTLLSNKTNKALQTEKSVSYLSQIIAEINNYENNLMPEEDRLPGLQNTIYLFIDYLYVAILSLQNFLNIQEESTEDEESAEPEILDNSLGHLLPSLRNQFTDLFNFIEQIQSLKNLINLTITNKEQLKPYITYSRTLASKTDIILPSIYYTLGDIPASQVSSTFTDYMNKQESFQPYLLTENVNHFNHYYTSLDAEGKNIIEVKTFNKEKIYYSRAGYNHYRDFKAGNFWSKDIYTQPQFLTFWFDFLEPDTSDLAKYSVPVIGSRTKVINEDKNIRAIHYKEIPQVIFKHPTDDDFERKSGYTYIFISSAAEGLFSISSKGKSAKERIDELLNQYTYCTEDINMSAVPAYHLQPNDHIYVRDDNSGINGEYIINKLTIPLGYNKMMSISATKVIPNIN